MSTAHVGLSGRIITALLVAALLPILLIGLGAWTVFGGLLKDKSLELQRRVVEAHARSMELYLQERQRALQTVASVQSVRQLQDITYLQGLLNDLNLAYDRAFVDLGVIDQEGRHLAYVGPFALADKNYAGSTWFQTTLGEGLFQSDVFLGFRGVPHFVIAVRRTEHEGTWVLRATISSQRFKLLVRAADLGETGDAFLINQDGVYQTAPRRGRVLGTSPLGRQEHHRGVKETRLTENGERLVQSTVWINEGRWLFVVRQAESEILAPARRALLWGGLVVALAILVLVLATVVATRHLVRRIELAQAQRDQLQRDLLRSSKLASLGELATGLAHEINNPLAVIEAEQTNIEDSIREMTPAPPSQQSLLESVARCHSMVGRCSAITRKMLKFGRQGRSHAAPSDVVPALREVIALLERQAVLRGVRLNLDAEEPLPRVKLDLTELEQVIVNLVNNALAATDQGDEIVVSARREGDTVLVGVKDTGTGIVPADLDRIFQPFFSTKPAGRGTGLGLSVCHGIVQSWGGTITVESEFGQGSLFTLRLPIHGADTESSNKRMRSLGNQEQEEGSQ